MGCNFSDAKLVPTPKRGAFDEYVSSENAFQVEGATTKRKEDGNGTVVIRINMTEGSGYDLGEGSEKKKHTDDRHDMYFSLLRWTGNLREQLHNLVLATGENEFGNFISVGWLRVGNRVTLARRYVDEGDERAKWDIDDLRKEVLKEIASVADDGHVELVIPPWQCKVMHADAGRAVSNKRQKAEKE